MSDLHSFEHLPLWVQETVRSTPVVTRTVASKEPELPEGWSSWTDFRERDLRGYREHRANLYKQTSEVLVPVGRRIETFISNGEFELAFKEGERLDAAHPDLWISIYLWLSQSAMFAGHYAKAEELHVRRIMHGGADLELVFLLLSLNLGLQNRWSEEQAAFSKEIFCKNFNCNEASVQLPSNALATAVMCALTLGKAGQYTLPYYRWASHMEPTCQMAANLFADELRNLSRD